MSEKKKRNYHRPTYRPPSLYLRNMTLVCELNCYSPPLVWWTQDSVWLSRASVHSRFFSNTKYCHVFMAPWLTIMGSGLDDWIYWRFHKHNQLQELTISLPWLPRARSIFILVLWLNPDLRLHYLHSLETDHRKHIRVRVTLRLAVYRQSVRLATGPLRPRTRIFIFQLNTCVIVLM
jgi:hypothetical protein